jgi:hypothetical protein
VAIPVTTPPVEIERPVGRLGAANVSAPSPPDAAIGVKLAAKPWVSVLLAVEGVKITKESTVRLRVPVAVALF